MPCATMRSFGLMGENSTPMRTWLGQGASGSGMSTYSRPSTGLPKAVRRTARILISPLSKAIPCNAAHKPVIISTPIVDNVADIERSISSLARQDNGGLVLPPDIFKSGRDARLLRLPLYAPKTAFDQAIM